MLPWYCEDVWGLGLYFGEDSGSGIGLLRGEKRQGKAERIEVGVDIVDLLPPLGSSNDFVEVAEVLLGLLCNYF